VKSSRTAAFKNVFFNLSIFQFLTFVRRGVFYSFMINYLYMLLQTVTYTTMLGTFNMIASSLGQNLLWGRISDRYKLRAKLIVIGETIAGFTYILVFVIHKSLIEAGNSFTAGIAIIFGFSILEFFWSMSDVGWAALLTDVTTPEIRGGVIGALNFIASVGRAVGIILAGFLYNDGEGFRSGTIFYMVTALLFIGAALMTMISKRIKTVNATPREKTAILTFEKASSENERAYKWFLFSLVIVVLGAASISQIFLLFLKLPDGLNASDPEMSLILTAWTVGGMTASLVSGRLADKIGRIKVLFLGLSLAIITPPLYSAALNVPAMALIYGLNGIAFWTLHTVGFAFAGDVIPQHKRGRLLSRYNMAMALSWGPAGLLIGGPLADLQTKSLGLPTFTAYANTFYVSSIIVALGTMLFAAKVAKLKVKTA